MNKDKDAIVYEDRRIVVQSNSLINACYRLSLNELRLLYAVLAQVPTDEVITDDQMYDIDIKFYREIFTDEENNQAAYRAMKRSVDKIFTRSVNYFYRKRHYKFSWVQEAWFDPTKGKMALRFSKPVCNELSMIRDSFTKYNLLDTKGFRSSYTFRFYQWFKQTADIGWRDMKVDEIREKLQLGDKYQTMSLFKKNVLDLAIYEINKTTNLKVSYTQDKRGPKIIGFKFKIKTTKRETEEAVKKLQRSGNRNPVQVDIEEQARLSRERFEREHMEKS